MERKYLIYKITSPPGKCYIGLTMQGLKIRWQGHVKRAKVTKNHPFYNAINKYGADSFNTEVLEGNLTKEEASEREKFHILNTPKELRYNISMGGETDGAAGSKKFWDFINANPDKKAEYLAELSFIKKELDWTDYEALSKANLEWRDNNKIRAYKSSMRALRIGNRNKNAKVDGRTLKEKLLWKHRRDLATQRAVTKVWAERSEETKKTITDKISNSHKENWKTASDEKRKNVAVKARSCIDRSIQGPAASEGIKNFWKELRKDPEKYAAYMQARTESLMRTIKRKADENL